MRIETDPTNSVEMIAVALPQFENYPLVAGAAVAAGAGALMLAGIRRNHNEMESQAQFGDDDMTKVARRGIRNQKLAWMAGAGLAFTGISAGIADAAGPYSEQTTGDVDSIAVIIDTSFIADAEDMTIDGSQVSRLKAAVDGVNNLDSLNDTTVTFIAAGSNAEEIGSIQDGEGRPAIITAYEEYIGDYSNKASADMKGALAIAEAIEPDKILVFGSLKNISSPALRGEAKPNQNRVSAVALGTSGSTVESFGTAVPAPVDKSANDQAVGTADSYGADSISGLQDVVTGIIDEQYQQTERSDVKVYERIRNGSGALLVGLMALGGIKTGLRQPNRKKAK